MSRPLLRVSRSIWVGIRSNAPGARSFSSWPLGEALLGPEIVRVVGLTMGIASHGIGTARALQINEVAGAFSGLGMGLNGVLTAILLPLACRLL
jgi:LrgB-like family